MLSLRFIRFRLPAFVCLLLASLTCCSSNSLSSSNRPESTVGTNVGTGDPEEARQTAFSAEGLAPVDNAFVRDEHAKGGLPKSTSRDPAVPPPSSPPVHTLGHRILFYVPNRLADLLDIFRVRLRVGPGVAAGVRATTAGKVFAGSYVAFFGGLPGPRLSPELRSPVGIESYSGLDISLLEISTSAGLDPGYSPTEFGGGFQLAIIGADVGVDPVEIADFLAGIFGYSAREDDF